MQKIKLHKDLVRLTHGQQQIISLFMWVNLEQIMKME